MKKVIVLFANGFEETEVLVPVDMFVRTGEISLIKVAVNDTDDKIEKCGNEQYKVLGSHNIDIICDKSEGDAVLNTLSDCEKLLDADCVVLPGGLRGAKNLSSSECVKQIVCSMAERGKVVCAICASPAVVLAKYGIINPDIKGVCYPGCEEMSGKPNANEFLSQDFADSDGVAVYGNVISARSASSSFAFAFAIIEALCSKTTANKVKKQICY